MHNNNYVCSYVMRKVLTDLKQKLHTVCMYYVYLFNLFCSRKFGKAKQLSAYVILIINKLVY